MLGAYHAAVLPASAQEQRREIGSVTYGPQHVCNFNYRNYPDCMPEYETTLVAPDGTASALVTIERVKAAQQQPDECDTVTLGDVGSHSGCTNGRWEFRWPLAPGSLPLRIRANFDMRDGATPGSHYTTVTVVFFGPTAPPPGEPTPTTPPGGAPAPPPGEPTPTTPPGGAPTPPPAEPTPSPEPLPVIETPTPAPPEVCEHTPFVIEGRTVNGCGADRPVFELTALYQPRPTNPDAEVRPFDDRHWVSRIQPAIRGWSREAVTAELARHGIAGQEITWAQLIAIFGAAEIEGWDVHVVDVDDSCGSERYSHADTAMNWRRIVSPAQFEPECPPEGSPPDVPGAPGESGGSGGAAPGAPGDVGTSRGPALPPGAPGDASGQPGAVGSSSGGQQAQQPGSSLLGATSADGGAAGLAAGQRGTTQGTGGTPGGVQARITPRRLPNTGGEDAGAWLAGVILLLGAGIWLRRQAGRA